MYLRAAAHLWRAGGNERSGRGLEPVRLCPQGARDVRTARTRAEGPAAGSHRGRNGLAVAIGLALYTLIELTEGVGLWLGQRWCDYFAMVIPRTYTAANALP